MPRNSAGTYTLPAGNPVVAGTTIDASWANDTMSDMANEITNSLSRTGAGGMLAPFRVADGSVSAPGLGFTNETNSGLYRAGTGELWLTIGGVAVAQITGSGLLIPSGKRISVPTPVNSTDATPKDYVDVLIGYADFYLGPKSSDPSVNNSGGALTEGATYWSTTLDQMRVYNGTTWEPMPSTASLQGQTFSGTGAQTAFTLAAPTGNATNLEVFISGVRQVPTTDYTVSGTTLTFTSAPPSGTDNIYVRFAQLIAMASADSSNISYLPAGTGAVATTVQSKLRETVSVKDFGAVGDGVTDDRASIQAAFDSGAKTIHFPSGTYWLGAFATDANIIDLSNAGIGVSIITDKSVELVCQTTASVMPRFFYMYGNSHFSCGPIKFRDTGYDYSVSWKGAIGFYLANNTSSNWGDLTFEAIYCKTMVAPMIIAGGDSTHRIRGVHIGQIFADDCYYGFNAQNQGDGIKIDNLIAYKNYRPYFVYGVTDHEVKIFGRDNRNTSGAVNICRQVGGLNTSSIRVKYTARDQTAGFTHILINHIDLLGGTIKDINIEFDIESTVLYYPVRFVNYTGSGGSETSSASSNIVTDVRLTGTCDVQAYDIQNVSSYGSAGNLYVEPGSSVNLAAGLFTAFSVFANVKDTFYQPSWTSTGTSPAIGNGSLSGRYSLSGNLCHATINLTGGSTTTWGSGQYSFTLPYTPKANAVGAFYVLDSGTAHYAGSVLAQTGLNSVTLYPNGSAGGVGASVPMAWATNDQLRATVVFPVA